MKTLVKNFSINKLLVAYLSLSRYADHVSVGNEVLAIQTNTELTPTKVINTSEINMQGTFCL